MKLTNKTEENVNLLIIGLIVSVIFIAGCISQVQTNTTLQTNLTDEIQTQPSTEQKQTTLADLFKSDEDKIRDKLNLLNTENLTIFANVAINKENRDIAAKLTITPNATSKLLLNLFTVGISAAVYNVTDNFDNIKVTYVDAKNKQLALMTIPNKAIKDIVDYQKNNPDANWQENPYWDAFWKLSTILYDESVPQLIPTSVAQSAFGGISGSLSAKEISDRLSKPVTHLSVDCGYAQNKDADAEDDGINYHVAPKSEDETVIPAEGIFTTYGYIRESVDFGEYMTSDLIYFRTFNLSGNERFQYFDSYRGYNIWLNWDDVKSYGASKDNYGILFVRFNTTDNKTLEAKAGDSFSGCQLRLK